MSHSSSYGTAQTAAVHAEGDLSMESSDQDAAKQSSETPKAGSGKINPSFRGAQLEDALIRTDLKRSDLARLTGVAPSTVYRWGRRVPAPVVVISFLHLYSAWAAEEDLLNNAIDLLDGGGTRNQVAKILREAISLRNHAERFLSELP